MLQISLKLQHKVAYFLHFQPQFIEDNICVCEQNENEDICCNERPFPRGIIVQQQLVLSWWQQRVIYKGFKKGASPLLDIPLNMSGSYSTTCKNYKTRDFPWRFYQPTLFSHVAQHLTNMASFFQDSHLVSHTGQSLVDHVNPIQTLLIIFF